MQRLPKPPFILSLAHIVISNGYCMQLTTSLARALVRGVLLASTIYQVFSQVRLKPFQHLPFYDHLEHLFLLTMAKAEAETTPTTLQRLIRPQPVPVCNSSQVGPIDHVAGNSTPR